MNTLPHYLRPGLEIVFIGFNPAIYSAEAGHYYARPGNVFWRQLHGSGLVQRPVGPEDDHRLMDEASIGFVDLCPRPTVRAEELSRDELAAGAVRLQRQLLKHQPRFAVFSGIGIYQAFARFALEVPPRDLPRRTGVQAERIGESIPYVIPSSSGLASRWHSERLALLKELRELRDAPDG